MVEQQALNKVNEALGGPFRIAIITWDDLVFLEKNARFMTAETYNQLVDNLRSDGQLSSVPFCWKEKEQYHILSGNHRLKAAHDAGIEQYLVLYTDENLSRSRRVAIQLSHNELVGQDDLAILKSLWEEIEDVDMKRYAGLDDKLLEALKDVSLAPLSEVNIEFRTMTFVFLPEEHERLEEVFKEALNECPSREIGVARFEEYERLMRAIGEVKDSYGIKNLAASLMIILDVFENHRTDLREGFDWEGEPKHKGWVPMAGCFGNDRIPAASAVVINQALNKMMTKGDVNEENRWQALEFWAADYLAGD